MIDVCLRCGQYCPEKQIDSTGTTATCPHCGYAHPFLRLPLFLITGASGAGKTALALRLVVALRGEAVVLDSDVLWRTEFATPDDNYRAYRQLWLRVSRDIGQSGLPVILAGTCLPVQFEPLPERRYFSALHYLGLVADDDELAHRLRARPAWRQAGSDEFIANMLRLNQWLKDNAAQTNPPIKLLDTSDKPLDETVNRVTAWIRAHV